MAYFTELNLSTTFLANIFVHNFTSSLLGIYPSLKAKDSY
jgi:hypothetical protein